MTLSHHFAFAVLVSILLLGAKSSFASEHVYHHPSAFVDALKQDPQAGKKVYLEFCKSCHAPQPIIPLGAPRFRNQSDWGFRLKQPRKQLLKHTFNGIRNMPARGGCFECSDKLLEKAIRYMLPVKKAGAGEQVPSG